MAGISRPVRAVLTTVAAALIAVVVDRGQTVKAKLRDCAARW